MNEALVWLVKLLAGEKIKQQLGKTGLKQQIRVLTKALDESQARRAEYADALEQVQRIATDRDRYHGEMMRLRIDVAELTREKAALSSELEQCRRG